MQRWPVGQALLHAPQWASSFCRLVSQPLARLASQSPFGPVHTHLPDMQVPVLLGALTQLPVQELQWSACVCRL